MSEERLGVTPDDGHAERFYLQAAEQGHVSAQLALGSLKAQNASTDSDWREVAKWYRAASELGSPAACYALAQLHENGRGLRVDAHAALALYQRAIAGGLSSAEADVRRILAGLRDSNAAA